MREQQYRSFLNKCEALTPFLDVFTSFHMKRRKGRTFKNLDEMKRIHCLSIISIYSVTKLVVNIILFFTHTSSVDGRKVLQQYSSLKHESITCKVQLFDKMEEFPEQSWLSLFMSLHKGIYTYGGLNCSVVLIKYHDSGTPDENGTYNGAIGLIQQNKQDLSFVAVRPDSLPFEPGKISPVLSPADATIISRKNDSKNVTHELTDFLEFDNTVYVYSGVVLFFVFSTIYSFTENFFSRENFILSNFFDIYASTLQRIIFTLMNQDHFFPFSTAGKVLVFSVSLFSFFGIHGILFNTINADLVVNINPPKIDSLDDLLRSDLQPVIAKKFFLYELLKASPRDSNLNLLWLRVSSTRKGIFDFDPDNPNTIISTASRLINEVFESKSAIIIPNSMAHIFKPILCITISDISRNIRQSEELLAPGILTMLMSHKIDPYVEKVFTYYLQTAFETDIIEGAIQRLTPELPKLLQGGNLKYDRRVIQCSGKETGNQRNNLNFRPFKVKDMASLFYSYLFMCFISFICHIFTLFRSKKLMKKITRGKKVTQNSTPKRPSFVRTR